MEKGLGMSPVLHRENTKAWYMYIYLIVAKAVPFAVSAALSYLTTVHSAILIRSQLEYDRGRAYTDSGHVFILAISHAHHFP